MIPRLRAIESDCTSKYVGRLSEVVVIGRDQCEHEKCIGIVWVAFEDSRALLVGAWIIPFGERALCIGTPGGKLIVEGTSRHSPMVAGPV